MPNPLHTLQQPDASTSPWSAGVRLRMALWAAVMILLFRPTPKPLLAWRLFLLRLFGARISGKPFVAASCTVKMPWNLTLQDRACLGPQSDVYNLAMITLKPRAVVAQQVYLCAGTHDFSSPRMPLVVGEITIGEDAFIGARAFILPGVNVGAGALVGACAVVSRDVPEWTVVAGNPARPIGKRGFDSGNSAAVVAAGQTKFA